MAHKKVSDVHSYNKASPTDFVVKLLKEMSFWASPVVGAIFKKHRTSSRFTEFRNFVMYFLARHGRIDFYNHELNI